MDIANVQQELTECMTVYVDHAQHELYITLWDKYVRLFVETTQSGQRLTNNVGAPLTISMLVEFALFAKKMKFSIQ